MPEIGSLVVDMALKSAEFIRELDKTSKRIEQSQARMTASVKMLEKAFGTFLTVRTIRQISNFTAESLKLAASMHGPLADAANKFLIQFEELQDAFEVGLAKGFLEGVEDAFNVTEQGLRDTKDAGKEFGLVLGKIAKDAKLFFGADLPGFLRGVTAQYVELQRVALGYSQLLHGDISVLSGGVSDIAKTIPGKEATDQILAYGNALELARLEQESFWSATVTEAAVEVGDRFLAQTQAEIDTINKLGGPLRQYEVALLRIEEAHLTGEAATLAHSQAQRQLASSYLDASAQVTGTLAQAFAENKAIQIANAVVNAAAAMVRALDLPFPLNWAQVAAVGALAASQIATISAAQPGSSKALSKSSGGGAGAATSRAGSASKGGGFTQAVTISIIGDVFGPEHFRKIAAGLNDVQRDGTALLRVA